MRSEPNLLLPRTGIAEFEHLLALASDSSEPHDAKKLLASLK